MIFLRIQVYYYSSRLYKLRYTHIPVIRFSYMVFHESGLTTKFIDPIYIIYNITRIHMYALIKFRFVSRETEQDGPPTHTWKSIQSWNNVQIVKFKRIKIIYGIAVIWACWPFTYQPTESHRRNRKYFNSRNSLQFFFLEVFITKLSVFYILSKVIPFMRER